jgi:hypothetical protein
MEYQKPPVPRGDATLISQYKIKMPGYGKRMERYAPEPTNETPELEQRFVMPKVTLVQLDHPRDDCLLCVHCA